MPHISRIFNQAVGGLGHGDDHGWNLQTVNQVIEDCFKIRVAQIIRTVMHDQQRVAATASESCRQVNLDVPLALESLAVYLKTGQSAFTCFRVVQSPGGSCIAISLAYRVGTERVMCLHFIQFVQDEIALTIADDFELVFEARFIGQFHSQDPQVGTFHYCHGLRRAQA